jgi:hypothetical protein
MTDILSVESEVAKTVPINWGEATGHEAESSPPNHDNAQARACPSRACLR